MLFLKKRSLYFLWSVGLVLIGCGAKEEKPQHLFQEILPEQSGVTFSNIVNQNRKDNVLNYPYHFNGGGVAIGDINNDGLADVYFTGNQVSNKLYLNQGNFVFKDITETAGVGAQEGWKTGVTMADVNHDGWLDIYVCRSALDDSTKRQNLLFINNRNLTFTEKAKDYGIANSSYSTHAAFFDYDRDGDLDLFVLNHSIPKYAGFNRLLSDLKKQKSPEFESKLFRNDGDKFIDVTAGSGLLSNALSFGLGVGISDINLDGWLDIYVSNDFNEEDYLYLNTGNGTFRNVIRDATGHVSLFSMGCDIADINNDKLPDIFTLDMMPASNERIKLSSGDDNYDKYKMLIDAGFHHQSMRNMLQLNNGNGTFSEIGQLAGISNTDWSWAPLFADFDGDGWKDLFVSNGYEKDYTNMQFLKFTVDKQIKSRQTGAPLSMQTIIDAMPAIEVGNCLFKNNRDLTFSKVSGEWGITRDFKSNGAAYADLDNDKDLDLVISVMNGTPAIYRNNTSESKSSNFMSVDLAQEKYSIGAKIFCYTPGAYQYYEFSPSRGFQSCVYAPIQIGIGEAVSVDSVRIVWADGKSKLYSKIGGDHAFTPKYADAVESYSYQSNPKKFFSLVQGMTWTHKLPAINDFKRQVLLPKMFSKSGPKMSAADVDGDGRKDLFVCGPAGQPGALFSQQLDGSFRVKKVNAFENDKEYQDEDAIFLDADLDGDFDLYVVSGGYQYGATDKFLQDRFYINDGKGNFQRAHSRVPAETLAGSCVVKLDLDGDKDEDLFVGTRMIPGSYPRDTTNLVLINDGKGNFQKASALLTSNLHETGMVCAATACDLDGDGVEELLVAGEWSSIQIFSRSGETWKEVSGQWLGKSFSGWWNCMLAEDLDGDGDKDLMVGNYGRNSQFTASDSKLATLVYKDFDNDKDPDPFFCYFIDDKSYPFASRDEALSEVPFLKPRFVDYKQYSTATLNSMFTEKELDGAMHQKANVLTTMYFENHSGRFVEKKLPIEAQFAPVHGIAAMDVDKDGDSDVIMAGNESNARIRIGKSDANRGLVLLNDGKGNFSTVRQFESGLNISGDVRSITTFDNQIIFGVMDHAPYVYKITN